MFVGREKELTLLQECLESQESSFVAIYGRRRIGKTEMVRHFTMTQNLFCLEVTGKRKVNKQNQISAFLKNISETFNRPLQKSKDWNDVFDILKEAINNLKNKHKKVLFIDELPWIDSAKSGFLDELAYFWNTYCEKRDDIVLIVCGSAASYMLNKVIHNVGPLHGRLTQIIPMKQFQLLNTKKLLVSKGCNYSDKSIVDLYMAFGGVAKYIKNISCKKTPNQNITDLCFSETGLMRNEYETLFSSLFKQAKTHYSIMNILSSKWSGYPQKILAQKVNITQVSIKKPLEELLTSGFISKSTKFGHTKRDALYRATDCFSYFHNKWIKGSQTNSTWDVISSTPGYKSWAGFAFENICHMHIDEIKNRLGISGIPTQTHYWSYASAEGKGAQIDMLIEHTQSKSIDIVECKYYNGLFTIDKKYKEELQHKIAMFDQQTKNKYNIRLILITANGVNKNEHYNEIVSQHIELTELFEA